MPDVSALRSTLAVWAAATLAACGSPGAPAERPPSTSGPPAAPAPAAPRGAEAALKDGAGVAVVDLTGRAGARPGELSVAKDATLSAVRWSGWGAAQATGRGRLELLDCDPNCAEGQVRSFPAEVVLSNLRTCGSGRFYATVALTYRDGGRTQRPAAYLQPPC